MSTSGKSTATKSDPRANVQDIYRLTPVQRGMLVYSLMAPRTGAYCDQFTFETGEDPRALGEVFGRIVARHELLRASLLWEDLDEPVQVIHKQVEVPVEERDLRDLDEDPRERAIRDFLVEDRRRGFEFTRPPLLRLTALRLPASDEKRGDRRSLVVFTYHHTILDGWSIGLVMRELEAIRSAQREGTEPTLPKAPRFRAYTRWLARHDASESEAYWRRVLEGFSEPLVLGVDRGQHRAPGEVTSFRSLESRLDAAEKTTLGEIARRLRVSPFTFLQVAWALALGRFSDRRDVIFGLTVAGRPTAVKGIQAIVGCFVNTLPMRVRFAYSQPLAELLRAVAASTLELQGHQHDSLALVQRWSELAGDQPLFENALVHENFVGRRGRTESFQRTNYPLVLYAIEGEDDTLFQLNFDRERFHDDDMERLRDEFLAVLRRLVAQCSFEEGASDDNTDAPTVSDALEISSHAVEKQGGAWNDTTTDEPAYAEVPAAERTLHGLFERQVDRDGDAVAVVDDAGSLTYAELDRRANRLARLLVAKGVGRGDFVAIHRRRDAGLAVAVLAVTKAGAAYLPIDPAWPAARVRELFSATDCRVVITQEDLRGLYAEPPFADAPPEQVDLEDPALAELSDERLAADERPGGAAGGEDIAYTIFTSGSTGTPKGVVMTHAPVLNLVHWVNETFAVGPGDRVLMVASLAFDLRACEEIHREPDFSLAPGCAML